MWAALWPILSKMLAGAAIGAGTSSAMGGDPKKGALIGAAGGGLLGSFGGLSSGASNAAKIAAVEQGGPEAVMAGGASGAGGAAAKSGFSELLKKAMITSGTSATVGAAIPQYGMSIPGSVPQLSQDDPMVALQQLMQRSKMQGGMV